MKRFTLIFFLAIVLGAMPFIINGYWLGLLTQAIIFGGFALGLDLLVGFAGMPSLGHAAFFGFSGYGVALAITHFDIAPWPAAAIGLVISIGIAIIFAPLAVRTRGLTFLTITLAFGQVAWGLATRWTTFTGGENGIPGVTRPDFLWDLDGVVGFYYLVFLVTLICAILISIFATSAVGMSFLGVRDSDVRMSALGYNVQSRRMIAFIVAAFFAAIFGVLNAFNNKFVGPGALNWQLSAQMLLAVVAGGAGSSWGPFLAGTALHIIKTSLIGITQRWPMLLGSLYVLVVVFLPGGFASLVPLFKARIGDALSKTLLKINRESHE